jgi:hypothetical protein
VDYKTISEWISYDPDSGELVWVKSPHPLIEIGRLVRSVDKAGYYRVHIRGKSYKAHRVAWLLFYKEWPSALIDHINGVKNDNRILNLRDVSTRENSCNRKCNREGHLPGTTFLPHTQKHWQAYIFCEGKRRQLGLYETMEEAHMAYLRARKELDETGHISKVFGHTDALGASYIKEQDKWLAQIRVKGVVVRLGYYTTQQEASEVYWAKRKELGLCK